MYTLFLWQHFSNNLYNLFLFYIIGNLMTIAKLYNVSKSLHCLVISQFTINRFYSQWEPHNFFMFKSSLNINSSVKLFINNFGSCFFSRLLYFSMKDELVRFFLCTSGWWVFLYPFKPIFDCPSDILHVSGLSMNGMQSHLHVPIHASIYLGVPLLQVQNFIWRFNCMPTLQQVWSVILL